MTAEGPQPPYPGAADARRAQARHADAVEAAREWQAEMRERMPLPRDREVITIRWPKGPYDFVMRFHYEDVKQCGAPAGWTFLHGELLDPPKWRGWHWSFMAHFVNGEWTMLPKGGKLSDVS